MLHLGSAVRAADHGDLGAAARTGIWPVRASLHLVLGGTPHIPCFLGAVPGLSIQQIDSLLDLPRAS